MVRLIANIPPDIYKRIKELIDAGEYENFDQFFEVACINQVEMSATSEKVMPQDSNLERAPHPPVKRHYDAPIVSREPIQPKSRTSKTKASKKQKSKTGQIVEVRRDDLNNALKTFQLNDHYQLPELLHPMDELTREWPWGQTNRYLPLKMIVRAIANVSNNSQWQSIDTISDYIFSQSAILGSALLKADRDAGRKRGNTLSTALPRVDKETSSERFINTFLCKVTPTGIFYPGGSFHYGFVSKDENGIIGLTKSGVEFCRLVNPILDGDPYSADTTLSKEETSWLREYAMTLLGEGHAFKTALNAIGNDQLSPDDFAKRVADEINEADDGSFRMKFNGVVSRMVELNLIIRKWCGTQAYYQKQNQGDVENDQEKKEKE